MDNSLHGPLIDAARNEWRNALASAKPPKPFGPDYVGALRKMQRDPRIAIELMAARRAMHVANGMTYQQADARAKQELEEFKRTFGGE